MKVRVLIGDDHALIREGIREALRSQYDVVGQAADGKALVEAAQKLRPDLIILDLRLPKIDGFEFLETIRSDHRTRHIPVVILSSSRQEKDLERCQQLGVEAFITKPLDPDKIRTIQQILKQLMSYS